MFTGILGIAMGSFGLFLLALLLALIEIEVEGKYGWSEKLPTWYRTTGFAGRLWGLMMGGKPLTGYHLFFNCFLIVMFHVRFFEGSDWSIAEELATMAKFFAMAVFWDFMWFVLNPNYGLRNYKRENIWWFSKSYWVLGLFPIDYVVGLVTSLALAFLSGLPWNAISDGIKTAEKQLAFLGFMMFFTLIVIILSPLYRRWYGNMRKKDEREKAGIFHRLP